MLITPLTGNNVVDGDDGGGRGTSGQVGGGDAARDARAGDVGGFTPVAEQPHFPVAAGALEMDTGRNMPLVSEESLEARKTALPSDAGAGMDRRGAGFQREDPHGAGDIYLFRPPRNPISEGPPSDSHMVGIESRDGHWQI
jgi:hypothetical protein